VLADGATDAPPCQFLLRWRKHPQVGAGNSTTFTDGTSTRVDGPNGIQERLNAQRFP
jgi:hypothetical protein